MVLSGIDIKPCALPQIIRIIISRAITPRRCIRHYQCNAMLTGELLGVRLRGEILIGAGKTRQPI